MRAHLFLGCSVKPTHLLWLVLVFACEGDEPPAEPPPADEPEQCTEVPCKATLPQCGCDAGSVCAIESQALQCVPAASGAPAWNEPCEEDCAPGLFCLKAVTSDELGICHKLCEADLDCGAQGICALPVPLTTGELEACAFVCDVTDADACPNPNTSCTAAQDEAARWYTLCAASGGAQAGESCDPSSLCASGLACVDVDGSPQCVAWCHTDTGDCPDGGSCTPSETPILVGDIEFGFCL